MKAATILAIVAIIAIVSIPLLSMTMSAYAKNTKSWPRGQSNGFLNNPNHSFDKEPKEADNHHCVSTPSGNENCQ